MLLTTFLGWAAILFLQNYSFTYVSRARNSNSLPRHAKAAAFSNGVWIVSQMLMLGPMLDYLTGRHGLPLQFITGLVYTVSTMGGSLFAHWIAKKTEKGKAAVGASDLYAQITKEEWLALTNELLRVRLIAEEAHTCSVNSLPVSNIVATKDNFQSLTENLKK